MRVKHAESVVRTVYGGNLGVGALWISGLLDDLEPAVKTLRKHAQRKARAAKRKLGTGPSAKPSPKRSAKPNRSR